MNIALLQIDPLVGDLAGNARLIAEATREAGRQGADLAVTPELAIVGYLPRDLLLSGAFVAQSWEVAAALALTLEQHPPVLVGLPEPNPSDTGRPLFNTAVLLREGRVGQRFRKALLPTYDVFDEDRYFEPHHGAQIPRARRPPAWGQHLRGRLERSRFLEPAPLSPRPSRGVDAGRPPRRS